MQTLPNILFEDDHVIAFDKPSGLLIAPDRWDAERENLMQMIHERLSPDYFNVHRIDADTSGVVLCAKTKAALDRICGQFQAREVQKSYLAITRGVPEQPTGKIDRPIVSDQRQLGRMRVGPRDGKESVTLYEVKERWSKVAFLQVQPQTGRMHQIRVHLAYIRCPVLADPFYGNGRGLFLSELKRDYKPTHAVERPLIGRLALHAASLTFRHPATNEPVTIESPLPHDFEVALKYLRKFAR